MNSFEGRDLPPRLERQVVLLFIDSAWFKILSTRSPPYTSLMISHACAKPYSSSNSNIISQASHPPPCSIPSLSPHPPLLCYHKYSSYSQFSHP